MVLLPVEAMACPLIEPMAWPCMAEPPIVVMPPIRTADIHQAAPANANSSATSARRPRIAATAMASSRLSRSGRLSTLRGWAEAKLTPPRRMPTENADLPSYWIPNASTFELVARATVSSRPAG